MRRNESLPGRFDMQRRKAVEQAQASAGQRIIANCGITEVESKDVIDALGPDGTKGGVKIDLRTCFLKASCLRTPQQVESALLAGLTEKQSRYRLCLIDQFKEYLDFTPPPPPAIDSVNEMALLACAADFKGCPLTTDIKRLLFSDFGEWKISQGDKLRAEAFCENEAKGRFPLPTVEQVLGKLPDSCYRGSMGAAALQIGAAKIDVTEATQEWKGQQDRVKLERDHCKDVEKDANEITQKATQLDATVDKLSIARLAADEAANAADTLGSVLDSATAGASGGLLSLGASVGTGAAAAAAHAVAGVARGASIALSAKIDDANRNYEKFKEIKAQKAVVRDCWHGVDQFKIGIDAAQTRILRRLADVQLAQLTFSNLAAENEQAFLEGKATVERERERFVGSVAHDYWLSEKVLRFNREFNWAKRLVYLAMRAVEFEFQESLPLRTTILSASHPDQLEAAIRRLQQESAARTINRRRPEESSIVLSLRDDVLALADRSEDATGERREKPARRFGQMLLDPAYAAYDKTGRWLGQGIPFSLGPVGALVNRCGERLWRVTATVQGDGLSEREPGVSVNVLKRNSFASQWCSGKGTREGEPPMQAGIIQPSRKLFTDEPGNELDSESLGFTGALVYPWFNIRRADFYKTQYQDGASEELAGRGLYGDYVLLFPKDVLEKGGSKTQGDFDKCGQVTAGFPLGNVEDVLIRFDYLSVDNLPAVNLQEPGSASKTPQGAKDACEGPEPALCSSTPRAPASLVSTRPQMRLVP